VATSAAVTARGSIREQPVTARGSIREQLPIGVTRPSRAALAQSSSSAGPLAHGPTAPLVYPPAYRVPEVNAVATTLGAVEELGEDLIASVASEFFANSDAVLRARLIGIINVEFGRFRRQHLTAHGNAIDES